MNFLPEFKKYLFSPPRVDEPSESRRDRKPLSKVTVKNYLSDISRFIKWFENKFNRFSPDLVTPQAIEQFKQSSDLTASSLGRNLSSLRKFFNFLKLEGYISQSPFELYAISHKPSAEQDPYRLKDFKNYLYIYNASKLTIKNYLMDIKKFIDWLEQVTKSKEAWDIKEKDILGRIDNYLIEEYKRRLLASLSLGRSGPYSPRTINRKLSSLRKYLRWAQENGYIHSQSQISNLKYQKYNLNLKNLSAKKLNYQLPVTNYSSFPPFRLVQKIIRGIILLPELILITPLASVFLKIEHLAWHLRGKPVFERIRSIRSIRAIRNFPKETWAPFAISTKHLPFHKKLLFHLSYTRPEWYKKYHSYSFSHYLHLAILMVFMSVIGFGVYQSLSPRQTQGVLGFANPQVPPRILSFQGRLTDSSDNPITSSTNLRFALYDSPTGTGSALLWQEVNTVAPDSDGIFSLLLGNRTTMSQSLFAERAGLWLGVTVGQTKELTPRQRLATVAYAENADNLQGLPPITQSGAGTTNVVLALNSSGNLSIGGTATPTFEATGGKFTVSGKVLSLTTVAGTNSNIEIKPDGLGKIDLQKPLQNTSNNNNIASARGSVEVDDLFSILATSSGQSAFTLDQNSTGPIISASSSGTARFTLSNAGLGTFADDLAVNGGDLTSTATTFNLLNSTVTTLNLGGAATTLSIGASTGTTTISNNLSIAGTTGITSSGADSDLTFSGTGNHDITASAGTLRLGATTWTADILASTGGIDLASSTTRLGIVYADEVNATTLVGTLTGGNLTAATFTINSDNATADTEDSDLVFERGTVTPNSQIKWDSTNDEIDFNAGIHLSDTIAPVASALLQLDATGTGTTTNGLIISQTSTGTITNAINVSDETITNAISVGANTILGTTANIDLTNFDVTGSTGNITTAGDLALNGGDLTTTATTLNIDVGNTGSILFRDGTNTLLTIADGGTVGNVTVSGTLTSTGAFTASSTISSGGNLTFSTDNSFDIGASGATRPRTGYFGTSVVNPLLIGGSGTTQTLTLRSTSGVGAAGADIIFQTGNNGATEAMRILNSGNVGIGTTSPATLLHVTSGTDSSTELRIGSGGAAPSGLRTVALSIDSPSSAGNLGTSNINLRRAGNLVWQFGVDSDAVSKGANDFFFYDPTGAAYRVVFKQGGNVGIGTTNPIRALVVDRSAAGGFVARFANTNNAAGDGVLLLNAGPNASDTTSSLATFYDSGENTIQGSIKRNGAAAVVYNTTSDLRLKENITETMLGLSALEQITVYDFNFISDRDKNRIQGFIAQDLYKYYPHAVSVGGDDLQKNPWGVDYGRITPLIVKAVQELNNKVNRLAKTSCVQSKSDSDFGLIKSVCSQSTIEKLADSGTYAVKNYLGEVVTGGQILAEAVVGTLRAGIIQANEVISNSILVNRLEVKDEIISPLASVDRIKTDVISPLASDKIVIKLDPSTNSGSPSAKPSLEIQNASGSAVATIDDSGNASFSGTVNSFGLVSENASVSGTLTTKNLIAENIESQVAGIKSLISGLTTQEATNSALPIDIASYSAQFANVDTLNAQIGTFMQGLFAVGPSSFSDATVFGQLSVGGNLILADNSIDVLGSDLQIQPLKQGGVSFLAGKVVIDSSGNLSVSGNAKFNGTLFANILSPVPGSELIEFRNASGSAVLSVNSKGDLTSSGSARLQGDLSARQAKFNDLLAKTFSIVREAQADTSLNETVASSSAGFATIIAGEVERTIITPFIKENSLIYITPTSDTQGQTPYIARQTIGDLTLGTKSSFTIGISKVVNQDIKLNWWIVN